MNNKLKEIKDKITKIRQDKIDCGNESRQELIDKYVKIGLKDVAEKSIEDRWKEMFDSYKLFHDMACWFIKYDSSVINMAYPYVDLLQLLDEDITNYARFRFNQLEIVDDKMSFGEIGDGEVKLPLEFFLNPTEFMDKEIERIENIIYVNEKDKENINKEKRYKEYIKLKEEFGK